MHSSCRCTPRAGALLELVYSSSWCTPRAGALLVTVHSWCWCTPGAGALLVLVHSSCWCTPCAGALLVLVHSSRWCARRAGSLNVHNALPVLVLSTVHSVLGWRGCLPIHTVCGTPCTVPSYECWFILPPPRPGPTGPPYSPTVDYLGFGCRWAALRMDNFPYDGFHSGLDSSFIVGSQVPQGEGQQELPPGSGPVRAGFRCLGPGTILPWTRACRHSLGMAC